MTPEGRFNQIEPVLADVVQKVDRLIEANGQIITEVSKIPGIERTVSITAKGVVDLTANMNTRFDQTRLRFDQQQGQISDLQHEMNQGFNEVKQQFAEVNQRFDQLITLIQERLK